MSFFCMIEHDNSDDKTYVFTPSTSSLLSLLKGIITNYI